VIAVTLGSTTVLAESRLAPLYKALYGGRVEIEDVEDEA